LALNFKLFSSGLPLKDIQTEGHLYHCMALVANSLNFTWSRWNLLSGYDKLIMQYRERLPGAPEVNHQASSFYLSRNRKDFSKKLLLFAVPSKSQIDYKKKQFQRPKTSLISTENHLISWIYIRIEFLVFHQLNFSVLVSFFFGWES